MGKMGKLTTSLFAIITTVLLLGVGVAERHYFPKGERLRDHVSGGVAYAGLFLDKMERQAAVTLAGLTGIDLGSPAYAGENRRRGHSGDDGYGDKKRGGHDSHRGGRDHDDGKKKYKKKRGGYHDDGDDNGGYGNHDKKEKGKKYKKEEPKKKKVVKKKVVVKKVVKVVRVERERERTVRRDRDRGDDNCPNRLYSPIERERLLEKCSWNRNAPGCRCLKQRSTLCPMCGGGGYSSTSVSYGYGGSYAPQGFAQVGEPVYAKPKAYGEAPVYKDAFYAKPQPQYRQPRQWQRPRWGYWRPFGGFFARLFDGGRYYGGYYAYSPARRSGHSPEYIAWCQAWFESASKRTPPAQIVDNCRRGAAHPNEVACARALGVM